MMSSWNTAVASLLLFTVFAAVPADAKRRKKTRCVADYIEDEFNFGYRIADMDRLDDDWVKQLKKRGFSPHGEKGDVNMGSKFDIYKDDDGWLYSVRKGAPKGTEATPLNVKIDKFLR